MATASYSQLDSRCRCALSAEPTFVSPRRRDPRRVAGWRRALRAGTVAVEDVVAGARRSGRRSQYVPNNASLPFPPRIVSLPVPPRGASSPSSPCSRCRCRASPVAKSLPARRTIVSLPPSPSISSSPLAAEDDVVLPPGAACCRTTCRRPRRSLVVPRPRPKMRRRRGPRRSCRRRRRRRSRLRPALPTITSLPGVP